MKNVVATVVAIVLGLISVFLVHSYIESRVGKKVSTVPIVVAVKDIKAGMTISSDLLGEKQFPVGSVPPHYVPTDQKALVLDKEILFPLKAGDPVLFSLFKATEERITNLISNEKRAVTLRVNPITSVAQQIRPGDYVDLYATVKLYPEAIKVQGQVVWNPDTARSPTTVETRLILTKVKVLSVDFRTNRKVLSGYQESELLSFGSLTIEATPEEAEVVIFTQAFAELCCTLRNPSDQGHPIRIAPLDLNIYKEMIEHVKEKHAKPQ